MVRDGRATVNSIISRKVTITGFDLSSYRQCMTKWNNAIETMHNQCKEIGSDKCMMVSVTQPIRGGSSSVLRISDMLTFFSASKAFSHF